MKKTFFVFLLTIVLVSLLFTFVLPKISNQYKLANIGMFLPFGGKITAIIPNTICPDGKQAFFIKPVLPIFPPGPYGVMPSALAKFPKEMIAPGIWVIGLSGQEPLPICTQINPPPAPPLPLPTLPVYVIGTSQTPSIK